MNTATTILALSTFWTAAAAQIPHSSQERLTTPIDPTAPEIARTDEQLREMVACVVRREPGRTKALLDAVPGTHVEARILRSFDSRMNSCYNYARTGRSMSLTDNILRGAIAEFYFHRDSAATFAPAIGVAPARLEAWSEPRLSNGRMSSSEGLHAMARCVVVREPQRVRSLLAEPPLSAAEARAFGALRGSLSACLFEGMELTASRQGLRGLLAEAAFHYAAARATGLDQLAGRAVGPPAN